MKRLIFILLLLPLTLSAQVPGPGFGFWKISSSAPVFPTLDSLVGRYVARDLADSSGKSVGDSTYIFKNRLTPYLSAYITTGSQKPTLVDSLGHKWLSFDGVDDRILVTTGDSPTFGQPNSVAVVIRIGKPKAIGTVIDGGGGTTRNTIAVQPTTPMVTYAGTAVLPMGHYLSIDSTYIIIATFASAGSVLRVNGLSYTGVNIGTNALDGLTIAASTTGGTDNCNMRIAELITGDGLWEQSERVALETYLKQTYGVTW